MILWNKMEKRLILAVALSILVLISWSALTPKPQHIVQQDVKSDTLVQSQTISTASSMQSGPLISVPGKLVEFHQDNLEVTFDESLAAVKEVKFLDYNYTMMLKYGLFLKDPSLVFKKERSGNNEAIFSASTQDLKVVKKFVFHKPAYIIDLHINIQNTGNKTVSVNLPLVLGMLDFSSSNPQARYQDVTVATQEKTQHVNARKNAQFADARFLGLRDQYFATIIEPLENRAEVFINKISNSESEIGVNVQTSELKPGSQIGHLYKVFLGPQDLKILNSVNADWASIIHYGTFDFISQILLQGLSFIHKIVHNWGVAIILLSLLVYLILYPLSLKQMRSMKEMQVLQPKVEALRKAYKDNPQKMNKEIMELYKAHKVNPLGGCLPLLLQMPIFFALYNALMRSIVLKGARFLWIKDLSEPDRLWTFPTGWPNLPILGNEFNILPIIMAIGMFVQQKVSSVTSGGAAAEQQKIMIIVMPIMFGLIFYRMPSGLVLYWFVNSILMLIFQLRMNKAK